MTLQRREDGNERQPTYDEGSEYFTARFHVEGEFVHFPHAIYSGGITHIYDYVELGDLSLLYLDGLCQMAGVYGYKRYYRLEHDGFVLLRTDRALYAYCKEAGGVVDLYVEPDMDMLIQRQWGSPSEWQVDGENDVDDAQRSESNDEGYIADPGEDDVPAEDEVINRENDSTDSDDAQEKEKGNDQGNEESDSGGEDMCASMDEIPSLHGSDEEDDATTAHNTFNPKKDMDDPKFRIGLKFTHLNVFKEAVRNFSIKRGRPIKFAKSEKTRCQVKCKQVGCPWSVYAAVLGDGKAEIRTYDPVHKCSFSFRNPNVKSSWLAKKYLKDFKRDPKSNMTNFKNRMVQETRCHISKSTAYRSRKQAIEIIRGTEEDQYALIWDYMEEIKRTDKGATIKLRTGIQTNEEVDIETQEALMGENVPAIIDSPRFQRLYCCLAAPKHGMKHGCRLIFGLDGCHLKHRYGGFLLTAVGIDPNNSLYPIAYAAVEGENKDSWTWFLDLLRVDLGIDRDHEGTIVSDKQKGLIAACELVFPAADHRFCLRHLHCNWALAGYTGNTLKNALYAAAYATTATEFNRAMHQLAKIDKNAADWLKDKPPAQWSRSHFSVRPKCDMLLNNVSESFNKVLADAREMPILSMFEWIRKYLMVRFQENRERAMMRWQGKGICPKIKKKLQKNIEQAAESIPERADTNKYECHMSDGSQFVVNLADKTCTIFHYTGEALFFS